MSAATVIQILLSLLFSIVSTLAMLAFRTLQRESAAKHRETNAKMDDVKTTMHELSKEVKSIGLTVASVQAHAAAHGESDGAQFRRIEGTLHTHDQRLRTLETRRNGG